ncbi:hypothetical protein D917_02221 [Trichinella nativa]|uniref:Uncharacterized protein n=1 Tax=Trichinella nativa TaxID=6335 RepID=A0A1Y3EGN5_9BILA|nr:hypothetical protein D917_02221 [Trichinella nativa]
MGNTNSCRSAAAGNKKKKRDNSCDNGTIVGLKGPKKRISTDKTINCKHLLQQASVRQRDRRSVGSLLRFTSVANMSTTTTDRHNRRKRCCSESNVFFNKIHEQAEHPIQQRVSSTGSDDLCSSVTADDPVDWALKFSPWHDDLESVYESLKREQRLQSEIRLLKLQKIMLKNRLETVNHDRETWKLKCHVLEMQLSRSERSCSSPALTTTTSNNSRSSSAARSPNPRLRTLTPALNKKSTTMFPHYSAERKIYTPLTKPHVTFDMTPDMIHYNESDSPLDSFDLLCHKLKSEINVLEEQLNQVNRRVYRGVQQ